MMAKYRIKSPDGQTFEITAPDSASQDEVMSYAQAQFSAGSKDEPPKEKQVTKGGNFRDTAANSMLFGFGDELAGATAATIAKLKGDPATFSQLYEGYRDRLRAKEEGYTKENPWTSAGAKAVGALPGVVVTGPIGAVVKGGGLLANTGRAALTGAVSGAMSGAGNSTADNALSVATDAAKGGAIGGALGGATVPIAAGIGGVVRSVGSRMAPSMSRNYAREKVAEAIVRDTNDPAFRDIASTLNPVDKARSVLNQLGPEGRVVDSAGRNTNALLDTQAMLPGATKNEVDIAIRARQAGRAGRMTDAADKALGTGGARLSPTLQGLQEQRSAAAAPLYDQLRQVTVQPSQSLVSAVQAAEQLGATGLAQKMAVAGRQPYTLDTASPANWSMRDLDLVKQGLDTMIEGQIGNTGKLSPLGGKLQDLKAALVGELDKATTDKAGVSLYKAARDAYAGPSALMSAADAGRKAMSGSESGIQQAMSGMTDSELQAFRVGAFEAMRTKIGTSDAGRTELLNAWKNPATREKLQTVFGSQKAFDDFMRTLDSEGKMKAIEAVGRGSQTASRLYGAGDLDNQAMADAGAAVRDAATGNALGLASHAMRGWNRVATPERVRDEIGRILLSQGQQGQAELAQLNALAQQLQQRRNMLSVGIGGASGQLGGSIGSR